MKCKAIYIIISFSSILGMGCSASQQIVPNGKLVIAGCKGLFAEIEAKQNECKNKKSDWDEKIAEYKSCEKRSKENFSIASIAFPSPKVQLVNAAFAEDESESEEKVEKDSDDPDARNRRYADPAPEMSPCAQAQEYQNQASQAWLACDAALQTKKNLALESCSSESLKERQDNNKKPEKDTPTDKPEQPADKPEQPADKGDSPTV